MLRRIACICILIASTGCSAARGRTTVVWIGIDGLRHDYLDLYQPPTLTRLAREGALSTQVMPIFPSLTFPNHVSQVTGRTVDGHGIPMNNFFDRATQRLYNFPDDAETLRAEPIWVTAKRQGVRTAVFDWPMSHAQTGPHASDYSWERYESQTDARRLERVAQIVQDDRGDSPLRLIIAYMAQVDQVAHRAGPESQQTREALLAADGQIDVFLRAILKWFDSTHAADDELCVILTTDHGMAQVRTLVNLDLLIGAELLEGTRSVTSGPVACINLVDVPPAEREARTDRILQRLRQHPFVSCWKGSEVPAEYRFAAEGRIGDIVVLLPVGYNLTTQRLAATQPAAPGATPGAHGYDPASTPEMLGLAIVWRYRQPIGGTKLGPIVNTQWHATVAELLGIRAAAQADDRVIRLP